MASVADKVLELLNGPVTEAGYELVTLEYKKEGSAWFLRLFIDKPDGVLIDDCTAVNVLVSPLLESHDPIPQEYTLEVSSPGIFRPLITPEHYSRFIGERIKVSLFTLLEGKKKWKGVLKSAEASEIILDAGDDITLTIALDQIARANLDPELGI